MNNYKQFSKGEVYVPLIDELFIGYEYYVNDQGIYKPASVYDTGFEGTLEDLEKGFVYTKYLDYTDILEIFDGSFNEKDEEFISNKTYRGVSTGDDKKLCINYDINDHRALIFYKSNRGEELVVFDGIIKSKNELKQLFKKYLSI